jgi:hypothetical protein
MACCLVALPSLSDWLMRCHEGGAKLQSLGSPPTVGPVRRTSGTSAFRHVQHLSSETSGYCAHCTVSSWKELLQIIHTTVHFGRNVRWSQGSKFALRNEFDHIYGNLVNITYLSIASQTNSSRITCRVIVVIQTVQSVRHVTRELSTECCD